MRLILASQSPARLSTLRRAGLAPEVVVSNVDEDTVTLTDARELATTLARLKCEAVAAGVNDDDVVVVGCDSVLEVDGVPHGKPGSAEAAAALWRRTSGRQGTLVTGHHVVVRTAGTERSATAAAETVVHFAELDEDEILAYAATGEPASVAGGFTVDGLGAAYITGVEGDHHNVVGISLPLLRRLLAGMGVRWHTLWRT